MARKLNIPKAKQIQGLRKALRNRKTPRQFIPSLKKRLAKLGGTLIVLFSLWGCAVRPAAAQQPVTIQPTQQTLASTALANNTCTGSAQVFPVNNKNQTQHSASIAASGTTTSLQMVIQGVDNAGNVFNISDVGQVNGSISGSGYFPTVQVQVTCLPNTATFTLSYSASGSGTPVTSGSYLNSQIDKLLFRSVSATTNQTTGVIATPFGSSSGRLIFSNVNTAGTQSISVQCPDLYNISTFHSTFFFTYINTVTPQQFYVPASQCVQIVVSYTAQGGVSTGTMSMEYDFDPPGLQPSSTQGNGCTQSDGANQTTLNQTVPISIGANSTQRLVAPVGIYRVAVCTLFVSVGVAGTIQLTEGTGATCGSGASNVSGAMTMAVGTPLSLASNLPIFLTNVVGDGLCLTTASSATAAGLISFNYYPL